MAFPVCIVLNINLCEHFKNHYHIIRFRELSCFILEFFPIDVISLFHFVCSKMMLYSNIQCSRSDVLLAWP